MDVRVAPALFSRWLGPAFLIVASWTALASAEPLRPCGGCPTPFEPCLLTYGALGVVRDSVTGEPIAGATIVVLDLQGVSAEDGSYRVEGSREEPCHLDYYLTITATAPGYKAYSLAYYATSTFTNVTIELEPEGKPEGFTVFGSVAAAPPCFGRRGDVTVVLEPLGLTAETTSDILGGAAFVFEHVPPGDYTLRVDEECDPLAPCWTPLEVSVDDTDEFVMFCLETEGGSPTPTVCPQRTPCVLGSQPRPCADQPCGLGCGCEPCHACGEGQILVPRVHVCECVVDPNFQTPTPTATPEPSPPASSTVPPCPGDCDANGAVGINELIAAVGIAMGEDFDDGCDGFDRDRDGDVGVSDVIMLINVALDGCRRS